jgi:hypothetical protein
LRSLGGKVRRDPGLFWLAAAVLCGRSSGCGPAFGGSGRGVDLPLVLASTINNGFFLLAVAHFDHGPRA